TSPLLNIELAFNILLVLITLSIFLTSIGKYKLVRVNIDEDESLKDIGLTETDLKTFVNVSIGISKHVVLELSLESIATSKKLAAGGGGEVFLAKLMESLLRAKFGEVVVQKIIFTASKCLEDAFYQKIGIVIMLLSFPHFCRILVYTENPMSIIQEYYPHVKVAEGISSFVITDFGITQVLSESIIAARSFNIIYFRGLAVHFAAPEAFKSFRTNNYSKISFKMFDVFSFGCLTYEVQTSKMPWH
ncbi:hypothetical protein MP638_006775, partial [Amoeboaphelidium occidentale]